MAVAIHNFEYTYRRKGKPIFVPTKVGARIGKEVKQAVEDAYTFGPIYYHLRRGGHVAAMHHHRDSAVFARIDLANFFYTISRRRTRSALDRVGIAKAQFYAKWSTVVNPFGDPKYALPYGFVQSPILASLVVATSALGKHLTGLPAGVKAAVYVDDISLSSDDPNQLQQVYDETLQVIDADGFAVNPAKLRPPAPAIDIFNCDLAQGFASVTDDRIAEFLDGGPTPQAEDAFVAYCASVEAGNIIP